jgi:uncharacterized protein (TIGR00295 family)
MDEKGAIQLLRKHANTGKDLRGVLMHSRGVQKLALEIARKINKRRKTREKADLRFIRAACILHDIGRFKVPMGKNSAAHGYIGGQILKNEGLDKRFIRVCETHVGYWVTKADVIKHKMTIPKRSYKPKTIDEKIISYADKMIAYSRRIPIKEVLDRYEKEMGKPYARKLLRLHDEIQGLMGK